MSDPIAARLDGLAERTALLGESVEAVLDGLRLLDERLGAVDEPRGHERERLVDVPFAAAALAALPPDANVLVVGGPGLAAALTAALGLRCVRVAPSGEPAELRADARALDVAAGAGRDYDGAVVVSAGGAVPEDVLGAVARATVAGGPLALLHGVSSAEEAEIAGAGVPPDWDAPEVATVWREGPERWRRRLGGPSDPAGVVLVASRARA